MKHRVPGLFGEEYERTARQLPVIGEQKDIRYYSSPAKSVLNGPETTGMGFWSINPYIGCAFGCAYCYARYTHRYVMERAATDEKMTNELGEAYNRLPPWLAFERNIFVKGNAPEVLSRTLRFGSDRHLKLPGGRDDRDRHRDGSVPAGRKKIPGHARNSRGAGRASGIERVDHHEESAHHARHRPSLADQSASRSSPFTSRSSRSTASSRGGSSRGRPRRNRGCARWRDCGKRESMRESTACRCCRASPTTPPTSKRW